MLSYKNATFAYRSLWISLVALTCVLVLRPVYSWEAFAWIWTMSGYISLRLRHDEIILGAEEALAEGKHVYTWVIPLCFFSVFFGVLSLCVLCLMIYTRIIWYTGDNYVENPGNQFR